MIRADARRDRDLPEPTPDQYADLFNEAILLNMIPYDYRVWDRYFFSTCDSHKEIEQLLQIHYTLRYKLNIDAKEIADWCKNLQFSHEVKERIPNAMDIAVVRNHHDGKWMISPARTKRQVNFSGVRTQWFDQATRCHSCTNCYGAVNDTLKRMRYPYLAFGMIVWRMRPCQVEFEYLNIWQYLGYDYVDEEVLFNAYKAAFSLDIGVGAIYFKGYQNRKATNQLLFDKLSAQGVLDYGDLTTLLENDESIWRLKEALTSGLNWKDVQNNALFKDVTQKYGYDQLHVLPATEGDADEVALNLEETYNTVFDENPVKLHRACDAHELHIYVPQVWLRIKGFALGSGTQWILKAADEQKYFLSYTP